MRTFVTLLAFALVVSLGGCSKKADTVTGTGTQTQSPQIPAQHFSGPTTSSTDPYAQATITYATSINAMTSWSTAFSGLSATQNGNTWTWSYGTSAFTETYTATKLSDGSYSWKFVLNGQVDANSPNYNNKTLFEGTTSADGKSGTWKIYYDTSTTVLAQLDYSTDANGTVTGTYQEFDTDGTLSGKIIVTNNSDKSGEVQYFDKTILVYKSTWQANGSGTWYTYDSTTGNQTGTGTWN